MANIYGSGKLMKHVGLFNDKRCVVILQLPEEPNSVHIVDTEALPELYHQSIMEIVESPAAQQSVWLSDVLNRRILPDGKVALTALYQGGMVKTVDVDRVTMVPRPNQHVPLKEVITFMSGNKEVTQENVDSEMKKIQTDIQAQLDSGEIRVENQHLQNLSQGDVEQKRATARNLMIEADMLQNDANAKREFAYNLDPSLRVSKAETFVDDVTGKVYKTAGALKGAVTRRGNAVNS